MKPIVLHLLAAFIGATFSAASTGAPSELVFPAGTQAISAGYQSVAINDNCILVGVPGASYSKSSGGPVVSGAGEVQVFSSVTGKFIRRLRPAAPGQNGYFGSVLAIHGGRAYVVSYREYIHALDIATGKTLWVAHPGEDDGAIPVEYPDVTCLAVDGDILLAGMPNAWSVDSPVDGFYKFMGVVARVDATTGQRVGGLTPMTGEEHGAFGESVAVAGSLMVGGSPNRDHSNLTDAGAAFVFRGSQSDNSSVVAPDAAAEDNFGASVAIARNYLFVGAPRADVSNKADHGKVYVFDTKTLAHLKTLNAPAALAAGAQFGLQLAAHGSLVIIGTAGGTAWLYDAGEDELLPLLPAVSGLTTRYGRCIAVHRSGAVVTDGNAAGTSTQFGRVFRFSPLGRGWGDIEVMAATKKAAPGLPGPAVPMFSVLGEGAVSPAGKLMHVGTLTGAGVTSASNTGLWGNLSGTHDLLLREGDVYLNRKLTSPVKPFFNEDGKGRFLARYADKSEQNLFIDDGSSIYRSVGEGGTFIVNGTAETVGRLYDVVGCNTASGLAALCYSSKTGSANVTSANDTHIGRRTTFNIIDEAREGWDSPITGVKYGQIVPRIAVNAGRAAYVAALAGAPTATNTALFTKRIGINDAVAVARKGDAAPGAGNGKFSAFYSEAVNANMTVFRAGITGGPAGVTSGVWRHQIVGPMVYLQPVALRLQQAPGLKTGVKFMRFFNLFISDNGAIVIRAQVGGTGVTSANDVGIWIWSNGVLHLLLREGDLVVGGGGARIGSIQRFDLGRTTHFAALVTLTGSTASNLALLSGDLLHSSPLMWKPFIALRKGEFIDRPTPMPVKSIGLGKNHLDATGSGTKGIAKLVNDQGTLFTATFTDNVELLFGRP